MSDNFNATVLDELAEDVTIETALRDIKLRLYAVDVPPERAEMVRDVIAMANTARRRGAPARIIFGIGETSVDITDTVQVGNVYLAGIEGQYIRGTIPDGYTDLDVCSQVDRMSLELHHLLRNLVEPEPDWDFCAGMWQGRLVAYMEIRPTAHGPYRASRVLEYEDRNGVRRRIRKNDAWIRSGSEKVLVDQNQQHLLYSSREIPYIGPDVWRAYAMDCAAEFALAPPKFFVPLTCASNHEELPATEIIWHLLGSRQRVTYIAGGPGAGKTTFLHDAMCRLSEQLALRLEELPLDEQPRDYIPIWLDLNGRSFSDEREFAFQLSSSLDQYGHFGFDRSETPENLFGDENLRFVILLDALDEMGVDDESWKSSLQTIRDFIEHHRNVKAIITSRSSGIRETRRGWGVVHLSAVPQETLIQLL